MSGFGKSGRICDFILYNMRVDNTMYIYSRVHNFFYYELLVRIFNKEVMSMPLAEFQKAQPDILKARYIN